MVSILQHYFYFILYTYHEKFFICKSWQIIFSAKYGIFNLEVSVSTKINDVNI